MTKVVQTSLVLDTGFSQGQSNLDRPQIAVQKQQEKKKNPCKKETKMSGFAAGVALFKSDPLEGNIKTC